MAYASAGVWSFALGALALGLAACHEAETPPLIDSGEPVQTGDAAEPRDDAGDSPHADAATGSTDAAHDGDAAGSSSDGSIVPVDGGPLDAEAGTPDADAASAPQDAEAGAPQDGAADAQLPGDPLAPSVKQLALGRAHGCSLDPAIDGLLCWGDNSHGQSTVPALSAPSFVATGGDVTCAIDKGAVKCWGDASHGQTSVPSSLGKPVQLAVGDAHVCALTEADALKCWGDNAYGQLDVPALSGVRALGAGMRHSCALTANGVRCWGDGSRHQLEVPALSNPVQLAVGGFHNCAIDGGRVVCWGGDVPALLQQIPSVQGPRLIAAGRFHSCVLDAAGVRCWGDPAASDLTPRELTRVQQLAVGGGQGLAHACARHQQGIACWGDDHLGQTDYDGSPLHIVYRAQADIAAPASVVWGVLMDLDHYGLWNPYTIAMKSTLKIGDPMVMTVKMNDLVTIDPQIENIRVLESGHKVCWGIDTDTPELNSGERCQWLEPLSGDRTRYVTEDLIEGTLNPVVITLFGDDTAAGFKGVASGLKARAEALYKP